MLMTSDYCPMPRFVSADSSRTISIIRTFVGVLTLACVSLVSTGLMAQPPVFKQMQPDLKHTTWPKMKISDDRKIIDKMLNGSVPLAQAEFDLFFTKVVFPQFTLTDNITFKNTAKPPQIICLLPYMRRDFKDFYKTADETARKRLNTLALTEMMKIAKDNYHPVARYNAMLLVSDLNESDSPEVPYREALKEMYRVVGDSNLPEAVRIAALIGITRHAKAGVEAPVAATLAAFLSKLAGTKSPPPGTSIEGHDWIRRRAIDAIVELHTKQPPKDGQYLELLSAILQENGSSVELRASAIEAMLKVKAPVPDNWKTENVANAIAMVAVDAVKRELSISDQRGRPVSTDPGIKYYTTCTQRGLAALNAIVATPKAAQFEPAIGALLRLVGSESVENVAAITVTGVPVIVVPLYDRLAEAGAQIESLATGKPVSSILPKVAPVNGTAAVGAAIGGGEGSIRRPRGSGAEMDRR